MSRPFFTLENPFAPEKHRSADDPKFVGKILGLAAEAARGFALFCFDLTAPPRIAYVVR